ncbi:hypothetical protein MMC10_006131 [Thelotrema lepadinum]|nr:hypothetical protein [Thelotrema lepadinum]
MNQVKRSIKIVTEQKTIDKPPVMEGYPMRKWNIQIFQLNEHGEEIPATLFSKATYVLHESFGERARQTTSSPPFRITEEGWGEFDMQIILTAVEKGGDHTIVHDLNFQSNQYEAKHVVTFKNPKPNLLAVLRETGPVPGDENGRKKGEESAKKRKRPEKGINMDKLAENLQRLHEDDLLQVVQMIHDHKSNDTYLKNDVDAGEFQVDLYTLPDNLLHMLSMFCDERLMA